MTTLLSRLLASGPSAVASSRARAQDHTTPVNLKVRVTEAHAQRLQARAAHRGVSVATVVREILDASLAGE